MTAIPSPTLRSTTANRYAYCAYPGLYYYQLIEMISLCWFEHSDMASPDDHGFATRSIHDDERATRRDGSGHDVVTPIHLSSTFELDSVPVDTSLTDLDPGAGDFLYTRLGNPTRQALEERLASLAGGTDAFALASGTAAVASTVLATAHPGDEIVAFEDLYGGSLKLLSALADERLGIDVRFVDAREVDTVAEAMSDRTALVLMESPTNPLMQLCDIEAIAEIADEWDVPFAVDNTFASPVLQRPLSMGADIVIHSTTKYLNGHSDGLGGAVVTDDPALADELSFLQRIGLGNVMAPFDAYLVMRGLKTLEARVERQTANATALADYLDSHDRVRSVRYPGLESHPQHALASEQMDDYGAMLSFELDGTPEQARTFLEALETFALAVSLGGVESLIELPANMTHESVPAEVRTERGIADTLIRVSVGMETIEDLTADMDRGFAAAFGDNA